jgi:hypothetical protein
VHFDRLQNGSGFLSGVACVKKALEDDWAVEVLGLMDHVIVFSIFLPRQHCVGLTTTSDSE